MFLFEASLSEGSAIRSIAQVEPLVDKIVDYSGNDL